MDLAKRDDALSGSFVLCLRISDKTEIAIDIEGEPEITVDMQIEATLPIYEQLIESLNIRTFIIFIQDTLVEILGKHYTNMINKNKSY